MARIGEEKRTGKAVNLPGSGLSQEEAELMTGVWFSTHQNEDRVLGHVGRRSQMWHDTVELGNRVLSHILSPTQHFQHHGSDRKSGALPDESPLE